MQIDELLGARVKALDSPFRGPILQDVVPFLDTAELQHSLPERLEHAVVHAVAEDADASDFPGGSRTRPPSQES